MCGEIDILEAFGSKNGKAAFSTIHTQAANHMSGTSYYGQSTSVPTIDTAFHIYALEWTYDGLDFFVDDDITLHVARPDAANAENWPACDMLP